MARVPAASPSVPVRSTASAAASSSIATTRRAFSSSRRAWRTPTVPMPTTSWLLAFVGTEPSDAGCARTAFSATVELAQYWRPIKPLRSPARSRIRNGGRPAFVAGSRRRARRRSEKRAIVGQRHLQVIHRERDGMAVKVAGVEHGLVLREERGIVRDGVDLDVDDRTCMGDRRPDGAQHLRHAAQRVGVLHRAGARLAGEPAGLAVVEAPAASEQRAQARRRRQLAGMRARRVHARVERFAIAAEDLDHQRGGALRRRHELLGADHHERRLRGLARGAVHQRERLASLERDRRRGPRRTGRSPPRRAGRRGRRAPRQPPPARRAPARPDRHSRRPSRSRE